MGSIHRVWRGFGGLTALSLTVGVSGTAHAWEYSRGCADPYTGGCGGTTLSHACTLTDKLADEIDSRFSNWTEGYDNRNGGLESRDYEDSDKDSDGQDHTKFDDIGFADLAAFSGHGVFTSGGVEPNGSWKLAMGTPWGSGPADSRHCDARTPQDMVLGEQGSDPYTSNNTGDVEFIFMDASCGALHVGSDHGEADEVWQTINGGDDGAMARAHQVFAFTDSPCDVPNRGKNWIIDIDNGSSNKAAWIDEGDDCPLIYGGGNAHPIVVTKDNSNPTSRANNEQISSPDTDPSFYGASYAHNWISYSGSECGL